MTFPMVSSESPRPDGDYLVFNGNPDVAEATLKEVIHVENVGQAIDWRPISWREEGTGIWSLGPFVCDRITVWGPCS